MGFHGLDSELRGIFHNISMLFSGKEVEIWAFVPENKTVSMLEAWLKSIDYCDRLRIFNRLDRVSVGNYGDTVSIGEGIHELRFHFGPGYRIYYAKLTKSKIAFINAGNKSTQDKDIKQASLIWKTNKEKL